MRSIGEISRKIIESLKGDESIAVCDPEEILEPHCDVTSKDTGIQYLGLVSGKTYRIVKPWESDGSRK